MNEILKQRKALADWAQSYEWDIFGTLNFRVRPPESEARKIWSSFFQKIDQQCFRRCWPDQQRFQRFVYRHDGANGDNPHLHFLAKAPVDRELFCITANAIWSGMNALTAPPDQNRITPLINARGASWYMLHEDWGLDKIGFDAEFTSLKIPGLVRDDALLRLRGKAAQRGCLDDAYDAYDRHVEAEQAHIQRH